MANLNARFAMDSDREEQGVWVNFGGGDPHAEPPVPDIKVQIRRFKSKASAAARAELERPYVAEMRRGPLPQEVAEEILLRQLARGVIVNWSGIQDDNKQEIPYSPETAYQFVKTLPEFRDDIFNVSVERDVYKKRAQ